jgi:hypothetical protein
MVKGGPAPSEKLEIQNNATSLLYDLMADEKNVGKILTLKRTSEEFGAFIKTIAATAAKNEKQLEHLAANDPDLNLRAMDLPPGEKAVRDATSKTKEHELLFSSGKEFEFNLLFSQAEALNYGWHLAKVAAENSSSAQEIKTFGAMGDGMEKFYKQVITRMGPFAGGVIES